MDRDEAAAAFRELVRVIQALRTPGTGCPWDLEQDHRTLRPYLVEEAYEVLDAIDRGDDRALAEELGDLLLQVVLHAQVADDRGAFAIAEVVRGITEKMVRRHPHVFGSAKVSGSAEVLRNWEEFKRAERQQAADPAPPAAALDRLPKDLPALLRAQRVSAKAAKAGLDEAPFGEVATRLREQFAALDDVLGPVEQNPPPDGTGPAAQAGPLHAALGDLLFGVSRLAQRLGLDAEAALRDATRRFIEGFGDGTTEKKP